MANFLPGETSGIPDFLRRRGLFGPLLRTDMPIADEEPGDSPVLRPRQPGPSLLREDEVIGGEREMPSMGERHLANLGGQIRALEPRSPAPMSGKRRLLQAVLTMTPTALGGIFGGLEGASGAASGTVEAVGEQQAAQERETARRSQERMRLIDLMEQERRQQEAEGARATDLQTRLESQEAQTGQKLAGVEERWRAQLGEKQKEFGAKEEQFGKTLAEKQREFDVKEQRVRDVERSREQMRRDIAAQSAAIQRERISTATDPNKPTMVTRNMAQLAQTVLPHISTIRQGLEAAIDYVGPGAGRWNQVWTGRVGLEDPSQDAAFTRLRGNVEMFKTAVMLAHARGRMSNAIFEHFQKLFNIIPQDPKNARALLDVAEDWMTGYANMTQPGALAPPGRGTSGGQQQQIPEGARGTTRDGKPVVRQGGRWVLAQ